MTLQGMSLYQSDTKSKLKIELSSIGYYNTVIYIKSSVSWQLGWFIIWSNDTFSQDLQLISRLMFMPFSDSVICQAEISQMLK